MEIFAPDMAIDLGSSNTLVYVRKRGVVINEPTVVVVSTGNRRLVRAVGDEALHLMGRTTDTLTAIRPIKEGVIEDFDSTEVLIRYFMRKAIGVSHLVGPKVLVSVPVGLPPVQRKAMIEAVTVAGARRGNVFLVEKPLASAIGTGLPVYEPTGTMVVDVGGGTTDTAVVSLGGIVVAQSVPVGGARMDEAIVNYLRTTSTMLIGARTAEEIKIDLAAAIPTQDSRRVRIRGRDVLSAHAMDVDFTAAQAYEALKEPCAAILSSVKWVLERTPPELAADIMRTGIHLTGSGARLFGLDQYMATQLELPVLLAKEPADCTINGLSYLIEHDELFEAITRREV